MKKLIIATSLTVATLASFVLLESSSTKVNQNSNALSRSTKNSTFEAVTFPTSETQIDSALPIQFEQIVVGNSVTINLSGLTKVGVINVVQRDPSGVTRIGGDLDNGTFCIALENNTVHGLVMFHRQRICWELLPSKTEWVCHKMSKFACAEMPILEGEGAAVTTSSNTNSVVTTQQNVPILNSRPSATVTLLMDFVGGTVQDPLWNGGKAIDVKPAGFTADGIKLAFSVVAERYSPFNVNVTTDPARYASAPVKSRMRVILTTTNFIPGFGGYAMIDSLNKSGTGLFSPTIPCFAFVNCIGSVKNAGEVCAHELGHTFGLTHDGTTNSAYYTGQGDWAPVMGSAYTKPVVQWSKGEYTGSNNKQDDIAVIASTKNVGFVTNSNPLAPTVLNKPTTDVISNSNTARYFTVNVTTAGSLNVDVTTATYSGLNAAVEIKDALGLTTLARNNPLKNTSTSVSARVTPGKYVIKVSGEGEGDPRADGYSAYGSIGSFVITSTLK